MGGMVLIPLTIISRWFLSINTQQLYSLLCHLSDFRSYSQAMRRKREWRNDVVIEREVEAERDRECERKRAVR